MKVLVTGSEGGIGKVVVKLLQDSGHAVVEYDVKKGRDIHNTLLLREAMEGCEGVVHLAAIPGPYPLFYRSFVEANVMGTFNVAEAAAFAKTVKRFVFSSSTGYYGHEITIDRPLPIGNEESPSVVQFAKAKDGYFPPQLEYGLSKVCAETLLHRYGVCKYFQVAILRFAPVPFFKGIGLRVEKAAEAVKLALEYRGELWYEVFNIASTEGMNIDKAKSVLGFTL